MYRFILVCLLYCDPPLAAHISDPESGFTLKHCSYGKKPSDVTRVLQLADMAVMKESAMY